MLNYPKLRILSFILLSLISFTIIIYALYDIYNLPLLTIYYQIDFVATIQAVFNGSMDKIFTLYVVVALFLPLLALTPVFEPKGEYGSAKIASISLVKKMGLLSDRGLILGKFKGKLIRTNEPLATLILAPPGTGKTTAVAIPNILLNKESMIITDIKGELYKETSRYRKEVLGQKVYEFNPSKKGTLKFNPFSKDIIDTLESYQLNKLIEEVAYEIYPIDKGDNSHWSNEARKMFITFSEFLIKRDGYTTIPKVRALPFEDYSEYVDNEEEDNALKSYFYNLTLDDSLTDNLRSEFRSFTQKAENEFASVLSSFSSPLNIFRDEIIQENLSANDLDIESFRKENKTLYITVLESDVDRLSSILKIFLNYNLKKLTSKLPSYEDITINLILDEFVRYGKLEYLIGLPALCRGYKERVVLIAQDYDQIAKVYDDKTVGIIESTTAYKVVFAQTSEKTAKRYSELIGDYTVTQQSKTKQLDGKGGKSINQSLGSRKLVSAQDLLSLDKNTIYILAINYYKNPIKAKPFKYFEDRKLKRVVGKYSL